MDSDIIDISMDFNILDEPEGNQLKSSNFGGGIELLMNNDKKKDININNNSEIDIDDLNNLENELNDLATGSSINKSFNSGLFNNKTSFDENKNVRFEDPPINLGQASSQSDPDMKTWDGYSKFNNIPVNPEKIINNQPQLSKEELLREKFKYLRKLESLEKKGVELTKKYSMDSSLAEMQGEYEMIMEEKEKQNSVKFQGNMMMAIINGIEFLNNRFDPFDIKLEGWGEQINENINDYDDIFGELHEKYKSKASLAPELKLLFQLGGSAMMVHMTNTMFKSALPNMDDIFRQNPDLMKSFQNATVNSMNQSNPGFSGFMSGLMNPERGPPPTVSTKGPNAVPLPMNRGGNNIYANRPDISMARNNFVDDGINIQENQFIQSEIAQKSQRPEMKGPSDISDILSGLKTKTINIQENKQNFKTNDSSTISINDLKELQGDNNIPKKSNRKPRSDKNTISLDI